MLRACYNAHAKRRTAAHLLMTVLRAVHQGSPALVLLRLEIRPRLEQFPGDLLVMV